MSTPRLRVEYLPHLGRQARRVTVACPNKRTGVTMAPTRSLPYLEQGMPFMRAGAIYQHEHECGACDTGPLWRSEGLEAIRDAVDKQWDGMVADALAELRN